MEASAAREAERAVRAAAVEKASRERWEKEAAREKKKNHELQQRVKAAEEKVGPDRCACLFIQRIVNPFFLSQTASYDVSINIWQARGQGAADGERHGAEAGAW